MGIDIGFYEFARRVIPPTATYKTITGPQVQASAVADDGFGAFGQLYLLPRMPVATIHDADYVISYGGPLRYGYGLRFSHVWAYKRGMSVGEVVR